MIDLELNILDIRDIGREIAIGEFKANIDQIEKHDSLWLIDDHEPLDCYPLLIDGSFNFQTFKVNAQEYRIFISHY